MATTLADKVMDAAAEHLCYLRDRWQDESAFEDFNTYRDSMERIVSEISGVEFLGMTRRPWGFKWRGDDGFERHTMIKGRHVQTVRIG
jgi:hypothetical protein